jgi:hypothetical protein
MSPDATPPINLRNLALAAVAATLSSVHLESQGEPEVRFLRERLNAVNAGGTKWPARLERYLKQPDDSDAPLLGLGAQLGLAEIELLAAALGAAVEEDALCGRALAHVQAPIGGSRPTLGLLVTALAEIERDSPMGALVMGRAMQSGLLCLLNEGAPLPERAVSVPPHLCMALGGRDGSMAGTTIGLAPYRATPLVPSILAGAQEQAQGLRDAQNRVLVLRSGSAAEGRTVAEAIASALQRRPVFIEADGVMGLAPWLLLRGLLPVFCFDLAPGERKLLPALPLYRGPVLALCGPEGSVDTPGGTALSWSLIPPTAQERQQLWQIAIDPGEVADEMAQYHRHGCGRIAHLGQLACQHAVMHGRDRPSLEDVVAVSWVSEGAGLEGLAQPLTDEVPDAALVRTAELDRDLNALLLRCRLRDRLAEGLGTAAVTRYHPGVRALLVGPSGTGKTLAAGWLATRLGLPLYRVDLAAVTSKYIGETEKNLAQLLARAEQAGVILLFDEADSLFGKRTDVKEANDRFANAQTNYLLQRIETFDGITILTSNSRARFDPSFARRLDLIIEFPLPGPWERRDLWLAHLGSGHGLSALELNLLAGAADLTGGHIRNAVLAAAVVARQQGRSVVFADAVQGVAAEYSKMGRQMPVELRVEGHG